MFLGQSTTRTSEAASLLVDAFLSALYRRPNHSVCDMFSGLFMLCRVSTVSRISAVSRMSMTAPGAAADGSSGSVPTVLDD